MQRDSEDIIDIAFVPSPNFQSSTAVGGPNPSFYLSLHIKFY